MDVGNDPKRQHLYVELVKTLALDAYRVGFDLATPRTPLPELLEEGTVIVETIELRRTIVPEKDKSFSHCFSSPYETISTILYSIGLTHRDFYGSEAGALKGHLSHISTFLLNYEDMDSFLIEKEKWNSAPLVDVCGGYFGIYSNARMLTHLDFRPTRGEENMIDLFHQAGFLDKLNYHYRWKEEVSKTHIHNEMWFAKGVPDFDEDEDDL